MSKEKETYKVLVEVTFQFFVDIEAEDYHEARKEAQQALDNSDINFSCNVESNAYDTSYPELIDWEAQR